MEKELVGFMVNHGVNRAHLDGVSGLTQIHEKDTHAERSFGALVIRSGPGQEEEHIGVLHPGGENFTAVDDVVVTVSFGRGANMRRIGAGVRLGDAKSLESKLPARNPGQVALFLFSAAVPEQGAHDVHLGMTGGGIAARAVDLFQNHAGFGHRQSRATVLFGDEGRQPAGLSQFINKLLWIAIFLIEPAPIFVSILTTEFANLIPNFRTTFFFWHGVSSLSIHAASALAGVFYSLVNIRSGRRTVLPRARLFTVALETMTAVGFLSARLRARAYAVGRSSAWVTT